MSRAGAAFTLPGYRRVRAAGQVEQLLTDPAPASPKACTHRGSTQVMEDLDGSLITVCIECGYILETAPRQLDHQPTASQSEALRWFAHGGEW